LLLAMLSGTGCSLLTPTPVALERKNPFDNLPAAAQASPIAYDWLTSFSAIETQLEQRLDFIDSELDSFFRPAKPTGSEKPTP